MIGSMLEEANKLTRLVDSLLTIARSGCGTDSLDSDGIPCNQPGTRVCILIRGLLEENGQRLTSRIARCRYASRRLAAAAAGAGQHRSQCDQVHAPAGTVIVSESDRRRSRCRSGG